MFGNYLKQELSIYDASKVKPLYIRQCIKYLRERGKYTVCVSEKSLSFFNFLKAEREVKDNPMDNVERIKPKQLLTPEEIKLRLGGYDVTLFHEYRTWMPEDIDFRTKSILVKNTENGHERYVFFGHKMSADLRRWMHHRDRYSDGPYLFPTSRGTQLSVTNFGATVRRQGRGVGLGITEKNGRKYQKHSPLNNLDI